MKSGKGCGVPNGDRIGTTVEGAGVIENIRGTSARSATFAAPLVHLGTREVRV